VHFGHFCGDFMDSDRIHTESAARGKRFAG
jgi:hypothetical protein